MNDIDKILSKVTDILNEEYYEITEDTETIPFSFRSWSYAYSVDLFNISIFHTECNDYYHEIEDRLLTEKEILEICKEEAKRVLSPLYKYLYANKIEEIPNE